ncbi:hypothetical protein A9Q84_00810 [Halobacteriovorax marinus]|uniref:HTH tetR-type domain-containing protein n=1 Tax=Halobacteriovorax marinus TaxID=97084 RepID=A0A1Y5FBK3_9BACT|nr:hypothetical protein A9Q84_00810 [Halobacteriovorax marinus]
MRNEILLTAEKQMMTGGFENLNFGTIAKELGTTRANLHYHFKNKESLAIEVTNNYGQTQFKNFSALAEGYKGNFFGFIQGVEDNFWLQAEALGTTSICVCTQMATQNSLPENLQGLACSFYRKFEELFQSTIQDAIDNGEIRSDLNALREARRSHTIMLGVMTCGQHIGNVAQAKNELSGLLKEWAEGLK